MKKLILLFGILIPAIGFTQPFSINWHKIAGGGGTSAGGSFQLSGTIGQHDAGGPMTGGGFSLTGGFWSIIFAVQVPGSPLLTITHAGNSVIVSWPSPSTGFVLQQAANALTPSWVNSSYTVNDNGITRSVTITPPAGNLFFRLMNP
jgi:hypothetical protein